MVIFYSQAYRWYCLLYAFLSFLIFYNKYVLYFFIATNSGLWLWLTVKLKRWWCFNLAMSLFSFQERIQDRKHRMYSIIIHIKWSCNHLHIVWRVIHSMSNLGIFQKVRVIYLTKKPSIKVILFCLWKLFLRLIIKRLKNWVLLPLNNLFMDIFPLILVWISSKFRV